MARAARSTGRAGSAGLLPTGGRSGQQDPGAAGHTWLLEAIGKERSWGKARRGIKIMRLSIVRLGWDVSLAGRDAYVSRT